MSVEITCPGCGEEYDDHHEDCPVCLVRFDVLGHVLDEPVVKKHIIKETGGKKEDAVLNKLHEKRMKFTEMFYQDPKRVIVAKDVYMQLYEAVDITMRRSPVLRPEESHFEQIHGIEIILSLLVPPGFIEFLPGYADQQKYMHSGHVVYGGDGGWV